MKAIYLSAALLFISVAASAQTNFFKRPAAPGTETNVLARIYKQPGTRFDLSGVAVKSLPLDNMPCFIPDLSLVAAIPTSKPALPNQYIPNPFSK